MSGVKQLPRRFACASVAALVVAGSAFALGDGATSGEYMVVWAGDWNAGDIASRDAGRLAMVPDDFGTNAPPGPDFLAVIDADPASPGYGTVVRSLPVPGVENEPHHMQYAWRPGERIFAGGLFSDRTFVFDVDRVPDVRLAGVVEPLDTPCGSVPDAYWVLDDGTAYGTYMGGPNVAGDPRCNVGVNNGFAGTPGEVVRISPDARVLGEFPAAGDPYEPDPADLRADACVSNPPLRRPSCANPHGIQAREDLGVMITSDYAEPRNVPTDPVPPVSPNVFRDTVRVWDISDPVMPRVRSVSVLPVGTMASVPPQMLDPRGVMGIMETTVTNLPQHRGAFASSMCGGQIWYTADITAEQPLWRQVFDATAAAARVQPTADQVGGCVGAGWLQTSPDDALLFQAVIGRAPGTLNQSDPGVPKMVYALDIRTLVVLSPDEWTAGGCAIEGDAEIFAGGAEPSCPRVAGALELPDDTSGGPHWGAIDAFRLSADPGRVSTVTRVAVSSYFVARAGSDGDHEVCIVDVAADGSLTLDRAFRDENTGAPCVDFDRPVWPHGAHGAAKPHSMLFVIPKEA